MIAIVVAESLGTGVKPAGVDGGLAAPVVVRDEEVVAYPGDVVGGGSLHEGGVGGGATGALEVVEFDDGDAGPGGGMKCGGVEDLCGVGGLGAGEAGGAECGGKKERACGQKLIETAGSDRS